ncbi:C40 family peptidase [Thiobacillus denitrificans]|uniref:C40 family peptidase n=1 Tax=Thiobacillus denitrificans TaxID=36861 RepID=UPI000756712D|nr:C40 family peptidase [Thiobacillus denitrificans]
MKPVALLSLLALLLVLPAHATPPPEDIPIYAVSLVGSPYRLGGTSPETGLDCSGFVGHVFRQTTGIMLPRDSRAISQASLPLAQAELLPGDLVFFNTLNRAFSHVGIYLGDDRFVHAASSRSGAVMVSNLNTRYWRERYDGARRITPPEIVQLTDVVPD